LAKTAILRATLDGMGGAIGSAWDETFDIGTNGTIRALHEYHHGMLNGIFDSLHSLTVAMTTEDFGPSHKKCMGDIAEASMDVVVSTSKLLLKATAAAGDGDIDAKEKSELQGLVVKAKADVKEKVHKMNATEKKGKAVKYSAKACVPCLKKFEAAKGCEVLNNGGDPTSKVSKGCLGCAQHAEGHCNLVAISKKKKQEAAAIKKKAEAAIKKVKAKRVEAKAKAAAAAKAAVVATNKEVAAKKTAEASSHSDGSHPDESHADGSHHDGSHHDEHQEATEENHEAAAQKAAQKAVLSSEGSWRQERVGKGYWDQWA